MSPRKRTPQDPVLQVTLALIAEHGVAGVTVDTVAATAKVSKATIYRHWGSRARLIHAAIGLDIRRDEVEPDTGSVRADLVGLLEQLVDYLGGRDSSRIFTSIMDAAARDRELAAQLRETQRAKRAAFERSIQRGIDRGELVADTDVELLIDLLMAPVIYRRVVAHARVRSTEVPTLVDAVLPAFLARAG